MRHLFRSALRILLLTAFLLLVAWFAMKGMQYHGDWGRALQDLIGDTSGIRRFFEEQVQPRLHDVGRFFTDQVGPFAQDLGAKIRGLFSQ